MTSFFLNALGNTLGHIETIIPLYHKPVRYQREILTTPDGDNLALDYISNNSKNPCLVLFHGLEGSSQSATITHLAHYFLQKNWTVIAPNFRGCGNCPNQLARAYHASDHAEINYLLQHIAQHFQFSQLFTIGISLGGSALLHYLATDKTNQATLPHAAATISAPFSLPPCVDQLDNGWRRHIYARHFLATLKPKIIKKLATHPHIGDKAVLSRLNTIAAFDQLYTAPQHGFSDAEQYWKISSSIRVLDRIRTPTMCINALNDPIITPATLPVPARYPHIVFVRPRHGGHGQFPRRTQWLGHTLHSFFNQQHPTP